MKFPSIVDHHHLWISVHYMSVAYCWAHCANLSAEHFCHPSLAMVALDLITWEWGFNSALPVKHKNVKSEPNWDQNLGDVNMTKQTPLLPLALWQGFIEYTHGSLFSSNLVDSNLRLGLKNGRWCCRLKLHNFGTCTWIPILSQCRFLRAWMQRGKLLL